MGGGWASERISLDFLALGRTHGLSGREAELLWHRLSDDPRFHLARDPHGWLRAAFVREAGALGRRRDDDGDAEPSTIGKETLAENLHMDAAPTAGDLPYRADLERLFNTSFADVRAFTNQDGLLAPHGARAAAFRGGIAFAGAAPSKALVAHELVHVRQLQTHGATDDAGAAEDQADLVAHAVARGARQVAMSYVPTARVSFDKGNGGAHDAQPTTSTIVAESLQRAQHDGVDFALEFETAQGIAAAIKAAAPNANGSALHDALVAGAKKIGAIKVTVELAGNQTAEVTLDDLLRVFAKIFLGPGLEQFGLTSFGNDLALGPIADEITAALDDGLTGAATITDAKMVAATVAGLVTQHVPMIEAAIEQVATQYKDPAELVELELKGAIGKLRELRDELGKSGDPAVGGKIAHLARYILSLSQRLGTVDQRVAQARKRAGAGAASLAQLEAAGGEIQAARAPIGTESATLQALGNKSSLIDVQGVAAVDQTASVDRESIAPEEAFAHHTDQTMANAQSEIAGKAAQEDRGLAAMKKGLVPERIASRHEFSPVYERWFGFFSKVERDESDMGRFLAWSEQAIQLMPNAGASGMMALYGAQRAIATKGIAIGSGHAGFEGEVGKVGVARSTSVGEYADRGGDSGVDYAFDAEAGGKGGGDVGSRTRATRDAMAGRKKSFDNVYKGKDAQDQQDRAVAEGIGPKADDTTHLYSAKEYAKGRDGTDTEWNYMMPVTVLSQTTGKLETVYEHKAMREEVARYLIAVGQHVNTVSQKHEIRDPNNSGRRLGDKAGRGGDVMASKADASQTYGDPKDKRLAGQASSARAQFAATAGKAKGVQGAMQELSHDLEGAMDNFFAGAGETDRLLAIILDICVKEYDLEESVWQHFTAEAIWEFAKQAMKIAALFWALKHLGPVGEIIAGGLHAAFKVQGDGQMEAVAVQLGGFLEGATACRTFSEARGWAWAFRSIADTVAQTIRDWAANHAGGALAKGMGKAYKKMKSEPRTVGAMREELAAVDKPTRRDMAEQLKARLKGALDAKKPLTPEQQSYWAMLNAVDEEGAKALRAKHKELPELDAGSPIGVDPSVSVNTPMSLATKANEARVEIDKHLAKAQTIQPYRVEVIPDGEFTNKFKSEKGRSAVTVVEGGNAVVYVREGAPAGAVADEAMHLIQLNDPKSPHIQESIHMLGEASLDNWGNYDVETRKNLFERKLEVEIDAKNRRLADLDPGAPERAEVAAQLKDLQALQSNVKAITPEGLQAMKASGQEPAYLKDPAWLFEKKGSTKGVDLSQPGVDKAKIERKSVKNSPAARQKGVKKVEQVGQPWKNTDLVYATNEGKVVYDKSKPNEIMVGGRRYVFEDGAQVHVKHGSTVKPGDLIVTNPAEEFRIVEVTDGSGKKSERLEFNSKKRGGWVQAGEHSTKRGDRTERAGRLQTGEKLDDEVKVGKTAKGAKDPNRLTSYVRVEHQNTRGQGFDDVIIEFRGDPPKATIRIIEVKDYPRRYLQLGEMTAIRENLADNMQVLKDRLGKGLGPAKGRPPEFQNLGKPELKALSQAIDNNSFVVEIHVGEETNVGDPSRKNAVLKQLATELQTSGEFGEVKGVAGKDVLGTNIERITQDSVDRTPETDPKKAPSK